MENLFVYNNTKGKFRGDKLLETILLYIYTY